MKALIFVYIFAASLSAKALDYDQIKIGQKVVYKNGELVEGTVEEKWDRYRMTADPMIRIRTISGKIVAVAGEDLNYVWNGDGCTKSGVCVGQYNMVMATAFCDMFSSATGAWIVGISSDGERVLAKAARMYNEISQGQIFAGYPSLTTKEGECGLLCNSGMKVGDEVTIEDERSFDKYVPGKIVALFRHYTQGKDKIPQGFLVETKDGARILVRNPDHDYMVRNDNSCDSTSMACPGDSVLMGTGRGYWIQSGRVLNASSTWVLSTYKAKSRTHYRQENIAVQEGCLNGNLCVDKRVQFKGRDEFGQIAGIYRQTKELAVWVGNELRKVPVNEVNLNN